MREEYLKELYDLNSKMIKAELFAKKLPIYVINLKALKACC